MEVLGATTADLQRLMERLGEPAYRGKQLAEWIYKKGADSFALMTNLPAGLRGKLESDSMLSRSKVVGRDFSEDGTMKFLLEFADEQCVESVFLPYDDRITACVSTQIGCAAGCSFCATGMGGFSRNLTAGEIVDQVLTIQHQTVCRVTNVVYMGMGEPLLNYDAVLSSVKLLNSEVGIGMRKITISTVGITPRIRALQSEDLQLNLAISLHAPDDELRNRLIPISRHYSLHELVKACRDYANATSRRVTYEYMMIEDVNDSLFQAEKLVKLLSHSMASVNLIPYNPVDGKRFNRSTPEAIDAFREVLESAGIETTQRFERGGAVSGACGQLRARQGGPE
jgi:23S rRNA (adenine2503-C2)-methyltransferase